MWWLIVFVVSLTEPATYNYGSYGSKIECDAAAAAKDMPPQTDAQAVSYVCVRGP